MRTDVVIAGAGPNGLLLACELALGGVQAVVLERLTSPSAESKANGLVGRVVEALDLRGLYEELAGRPGPPRMTPGFQFAGMPLAHPIHTLPVPQARIEQVLRARALELGVEIRQGHELTGFAQNDSNDSDGEKDSGGITVEVDGASHIQARYLVGADGGQSRVRKLAGIGFPGTTDDKFVSRAGHAVVDTTALAHLRPYTQHRFDAGVISFGAMPPGSAVHTVSAFEWDGPRVGDEVPMTFEELAAAFTRVIGIDVAMTPPTAPGPHLLRRVVGINSRQADAYRAGRVLLLGDAAHVHSAVGGPGLNLGLQDALNLGWKLAAEVRGTAPAGLLDTYESERAPVSRRVLMQTRSQMALLRPGEEVTAARALFAELLDDEANRSRIVALMSGSDVRYSALNSHEGPATPHAGGWALDLKTELANSWSEIAEAMREARPITVTSPVNGAITIRPDGYIA